MRGMEAHLYFPEVRCVGGWSFLSMYDTTFSFLRELS